MILSKLARWVWKAEFKAEYNQGYKDALDRVLLIPEKIRLGAALELVGDQSMDHCSFIGGGLVIKGGSLSVSDSIVSHCDIGFKIEDTWEAKDENVTD